MNRAISLVLALLFTSPLYAQELVMDFTPGGGASSFTRLENDGGVSYLSNDHYLVELRDGNMVKVDSAQALDSGGRFNNTYLQLIHAADGKVWYVKSTDNTYYDSSTIILKDLALIERDENGSLTQIDTLSNSIINPFHMRTWNGKKYAAGFNKLLRTDDNDLYIYPEEAPSTDIVNSGYYPVGEFKDNLLWHLKTLGPTTNGAKWSREFGLRWIDQNEEMHVLADVTHITGMEWSVLSESVIYSTSLRSGADGSCEPAIIRSKLAEAAPDTLLRVTTPGQDCLDLQSGFIPRNITKGNDETYFQVKIRNANDSDSFAYYKVGNDSIEQIEASQIPDFSGPERFYSSLSSPLSNYRYRYAHETFRTGSDGTPSHLKLVLERVDADGQAERIWESDRQIEASYYYNRPLRTPLVVGAQVFFVGDSSAEGLELWHVLGDRIERLTDINPGSESADPTILGASADKLYFSAYQPNTGEELWSVDLFVSPVSNEEEFPESPQVGFEIYPNPLQSGSSFTMQSEHSVDALRMFDTLGRLVHEEQELNSGTQRISTSRLAKGVYIVQLETKSGSAEKKLVVR